ncbi:MAG: 3-hydroxyacyl-ACP dehydratase FabZ family protein [Acidobacteriota bacterium]|jgi:3-hydroxyacyl-[acyl-carrier-protein] dehydratase
MDISAPFGQDVIRSILPHRPPFLLVDRVEELEPEQRIVCVKTLHPDEYYQSPMAGGGRFYPITLLAEIVAQSGAMLVLLRPGYQGRPIYFMAIDRFEVARPIRLGETLVVEGSPTRMRRRFGTLKGVARVDGEPVAEGVMRFAMEPSEFRSEG